MTHLPRDFLDVAGTSDYRAGSGCARSFQSLAERFERIDDEVRRLETLINPAGDSLLARTKVDRMALLQAIAIKIVEVPADLSDRVGMRINSQWNAFSDIRLAARLRKHVRDDPRVATHGTLD